MRPLMLILVVAALLTVAAVASAAVLAFEGTVPLEDMVDGRCDISTPGEPQPCVVFWSAIRPNIYYYSVVWAERGEKFYVRRDDIFPGTYTVTVMSRKLGPNAKLSCPTSITITTK